MCRNTYFYSAFEHQPKLGKKGAKKSDNFSHFAKHRLIKKTVLLQHPFSPKIVFFKLFVLKPKTFMLNKKHNLKSGKKTKIRKRDLKGKTRQETIKREKIDEKIKLQFKMFMLFFSENKSKEERNMKRDKNKKQKESKKERQEGRKKDKSKRERERQRKRNRKRGRSKKVERERKWSKENKPKNAFLGGKTGFFY